MGGNPQFNGVEGGVVSGKRRSELGRFSSPHTLVLVVLVVLVVL